MRFSNFLLLLLVLMIFSLNLQGQNSCSQNFKLAEKKFEGGHLREIPGILSDCLFKKQFSSEEMLKAYKMLTLTYLYLDDSLNAEISFYKLLKEFPDFHINKSLDPAELVNLFQTYRTFSLYSFGIQAGANSTHTSALGLHGIDNLSERKESYKPLLGYSAGFRIEIPLSKRVFFASGSNLNITRYKNTRSLSTTTLLVDNESQSFAEVTFVENQSWINIPISVGLNIGNNRVKHYLFGGASTGYLLSAKAKVNRKSTYSSSPASEITGPDINVKDLRNTFNYWGIIGGGIRIKSGLNHINIEAQYNYGMSNIINPSKRFTHSQLLNRYGYLDNDVRMNYLTLRGSYMISRYQPKKILK